MGNSGHSTPWVWLWMVGIPRQSPDEMAGLRLATKRDPLWRRAVVLCSWLALSFALFVVVLWLAFGAVGLALGFQDPQNGNWAVDASWPLAVVAIVAVAGSIIAGFGLAAVGVAAVVRRTRFIGERALEQIMRHGG